MARPRSVIAHRLMLGIGIALALAPGAASASDAACFGGKPEVLVRDQPQASELHVHGRTLLWSSRDRVRSLDLDTGALATLGTGDIHAVDDRYVVTISGRNQLSAFDRRARKQRVLVDGSRAFEIALVSSSVAIHRGYVYFGFKAPEFRRDEAGFFRVPIDSRRRAERLAPAPDGETPFIVAGDQVVWMDAEAGGFLVYKRPVGERGNARAERRPFPAGHPFRGVPSLDSPRLVGDELYFAANNAVWSVALGRSEPARERVPAAWSSAQVLPTMVVQGPCVYFTDGGELRRARLDASAGSEKMVPSDQLSDTGMASDGRYLYWASRDGAIMRSGPSAAAHVARPPLFAKPAPSQPNPEAHAHQLIVGDDFGCALLSRDWTTAVNGWRCWRAGAPGRVRAFPMPGLDGVSFALGAGRVCAMERDGLRCLPASQVLDSKGDVLRPGGERSAGPEGGRVVGVAVTGKNALTHLFVGGTFTCTLGNDGWRCTGDDGYGQLASGALAAPARSVAGEWRVTQGALGAWHGCVTTEDGRTLCWGRNDVGQLGHASPDVCHAGDATVPCTRAPRETAAPKHHGLVAGDQFTCAAGRGLWCWGGSRDGVFGTADACGATLRRSWPTRVGVVAAPRATCARAPVRVSGFADADAGRPSPAWQRARRFHSGPYERTTFADFSVGPRGICAIAYGRVRCRGAVPTPEIPQDGPELLGQVGVSSGDRPSACASDGRKVFCWGAGYSPESQPSLPIEVDFEAGTSRGAPVVDAPASAARGWPKECLVHHACAATSPPLPTCAGRADVPAWGELRPRAATLVGTKISVRGALGVGRPSGECHHRSCCNTTSAREIVVGATDLDAGGLLVLAGPSCQGDDSRLCCTVPAYGQQVRVEGKLARYGPTNYQLEAPKVCQESAAR